MVIPRVVNIVLLLGILMFATPSFAAIDLKYAGSTTVQMGFMYDGAAAYKIAHDKRISIMGGSSSAGVRGVVLGTIDIGGASRELKAKEKAMGVVAYRIAWDAIAIIVHKENKISDLSMDQLEKIFTGVIKNWQEVGGPDAPISVITSHAGSATKEVIHEIVMNKKPWAKNAVMVNSTRDEVGKVIEDRFAIGGVSASFADAQEIKIISVGGVDPKPENIKNQSYKIARPLNLLTMGPAAGEAKNFIDFMLSAEGQEIIGRKFIPVQ